MEYRPYYLAREWIKTGHRVRIVGASYSHLRIENPVLDAGRKKETIDGIDYFWLKTPAYSGNGAMRIVNMLSFIVGLYRHRREILRDYMPDVVIASSTYPLDIFPARTMARQCSAILVYEVHDLWPLSPMELGGYSTWNPYIMAIQAAEDYAYRYCDKVVSLLPCAEPHMRSRGLAEGKFHHIPNGIDASECLSDCGEMPPGHQMAIAAAKVGGRKLVCYAGSHGLANALDAYLDAAKWVSKAGLVFLLVGNGPEKARLEARIAAEGIVNAISLPAVRKDAMPALLAEMDILYIGLQRQSLFRFGISPNKIMDYMMAGKPVIQAIEAGNDPTTEAGCGISVPAEDARAIAEAAVKLAEMSDKERRRIGAQGREYVARLHDYRVVAKRFIEVLNKE